MSISKNDIANNLSGAIRISKKDSRLFVETFINIIKSNSKKSSVKIALFGTFHKKNSPQRIGRNPKTKKEFVISERSKLNFFASNKLKKLLN